MLSMNWALVPSGGATVMATPGCSHGAEVSFQPLGTAIESVPWAPRSRTSADAAMGSASSRAESRNPGFMAMGDSMAGGVGAISFPPRPGEHGEDGLLHVQPVLRLVEYDRARVVQHGLVDLLARVGRQAVHEKGAGLGGREDPGRDRVGAHQGGPLG